MANVTNNDLLNELQVMDSSFNDKIAKLNKYIIGRLVHFEQQHNIMATESKVLKHEFDNLNRKYNDACEEIKEIKFELNTLQKIIKETNVNRPANIDKTNIDKSTMEDKSEKTVVCDEKVLTNTLTNIFNEHGVSKDVDTVKIEVNILKQHNMCNDLIITGIAEVKNENLLAKVNDALVQYDIEVNATDLKNIYRLRNSKCGVNSPILLELKSYDKKNLIMEKQKLNGPIVLNNKEMSICWDDLQKVFFKHRLTQENLSLLRTARKFGRAHDYSYIWTTKDGKILMKKSSNMPSRKISSLRDLMNC